MVKRPPAGTIPEAPGSYQFKDAHGRVIYVGKASNLRQRLSNYFQSPVNLHPRTAQMVETAESVEWTIVRNEVEALMLEYSLIKQHDPRFNVRLRDDKSYPFLAVTIDEQWPRALVMRGRKRKGTRYFGPYAHAYAIRDTLDLLLRSFPIRTCSQAKFNQHERLGRPCLLFHIEKCAGPCVGEIEEMPYRQLVTDLCEFLDGDTDEIVDRLEADMQTAATDLEFERAARLRDRLLAVRKAIEKQQMVAERSEDLDVIGIAEDELEAAVQVFYVRKGRVVGRKGFILDKVEELTPGRLIDRILESMYGDDPILGVPKQVLVPYEAEELATYEEWLSMGRGSRVQVRVPQRGDKRSLLETVTRNAEGEFTRHRMKRASDHNSRSRALTELQDHLGLPEAPLRIECYDMAHLQGSDYVGSMVVLEDGLPNKREYRRFKVNTVGGDEVSASDDYAAMAEVVRRRLQAYLDERDRPVNERGDKPGKFAYPPQLLAGRRRQGPAQRRQARDRRTRPHRRDPGRRPGETVRGGVRPGAQRTGRDPAGERGAVHAPADPRRGPPVRQHVPPRAPQQADDHQRARRDPRSRRGAPEEAGEGARRGERGETGRTRRAEGAELPARCRRRGGLREVQRRLTRPQLSCGTTSDCNVR